MRQAVVCSSPRCRLFVVSVARDGIGGLGGTCSKSKPTPQDLLLVVESVWSSVERHTCLSVQAAAANGQRIGVRARVVRYLTLSRAVLGLVLAVAVMAVVSIVGE
jgi:hypothetical protein